MRLLHTFRSPLAIVFIVVSPFLCCFTTITGIFVVDAVWCNGHAASADQWIKSTFAEVIKITDDTQLELINEPSAGWGGGTLLYLGGMGLQSFGTNRTYEEVTESYVLWFETNGWEARDIPIDFGEMLRFNHEEREITHLFYLPKSGYARYVSIAPMEPDDQNLEYNTLYSVKVQVFDVDDGRRCSW